ncbi:MAG: glutamate racemase [bacterium]|nr:glutamate racemase [bacterium]
MIGIFDSGLGGLTVAREIIKKLPGQPIVYFGDTARTPYGNKGKKTIIKYAIEDAKFLLQQGADIIVIGCNTVSAVAAEVLREKFNLPIFDVIEPAVEAALRITKNNRIGVIGTRATIASGVYQKKLKIKNLKLKICEAACPLFVPLAEEGWVNSPEALAIAKKYLAPLKKAKVDTLILGCTHYPFLKPIIRRVMGGQVKLIDSAQAVADKLKDTYPKGQAKKNTFKHKIFFSDLTPFASKVARAWLGNGSKIKIAPTK